VAPARHPVVIVGAGPVGLTLAIDLAQRGQPVLLLDRAPDKHLTPSAGSRAICFAKRTLEIWDRLGAGDTMVAQGVRWNVGRVFLRDELLYQFDLLPEAGHERPAFINLQQYHAEAALLARAAALANLQIRWDSKVMAVEHDEHTARIEIENPVGRVVIDADWLIACDGSRSAVRGLLGLDAAGRTFQDRFLIADVRMNADFPAERWFWFDPPFHPGQSVLLHMQPDGVWRIDFQLGWDADPELEKQPERVLARVRAMLAHAGHANAELELVWASVYTFACQRMASFRHGRVLFAGDSAHGVSPFGARGANSGVQDADNLGWKLDAVLRGQAGDALLDSYAREREVAADENILHSTRSTDFITPKTEISRLFRDAVLDLAREHPFARSLLNSGRLSTPCRLHGEPAPDAPLRIAGQPTWLLRELGRDDRFTLLVWGVPPSWAHTLPLRVLALSGREDTQGLLAERLDLRPGCALLLRPDQHVFARWPAPTEAAVRAALNAALGKLISVTQDAAPCH